MTRSDEIISYHDALHRLVDAVGALSDSENVLSCIPEGPERDELSIAWEHAATVLDIKLSAPSTTENRATLPGSADEAVGGADPWIEDRFGCLNLVIDGVHIWIEKRPAYCDRGHYCGKVNGLPTIDDADSFPRYFMDLERAKAEMSEWLAWRLKQERANG